MIYKYNPRDLGMSWRRRVTRFWDVMIDLVVTIWWVKK